MFQVKLNNLRQSKNFLMQINRMIYLCMILIYYRAKHICGIYILHYTAFYVIVNSYKPGVM